MRLQPIPPDAYARHVLVETAALWAGKRNLDRYVDDNLAIARSPFGKRHYRTVGLYENRVLLASCKQYDRTLHFGTRRFRAVGLGAVFTPTAMRGRGYATAMIAAVLDRARANGYDIAYLFSDIGPQFYGAIGFTELPSREIVLRADALPAKRTLVTQLRDGDWSGVRRCFDLAQRGHVHFDRTAPVWQWIVMRMRQRSENPDGQPFNLVVRHGRGVGAYVLGTRLPKRDAYVVEEYGFADEAAALTIPSLLRAAAGDLRRVVGWLPPHGAREVLPRGAVRKRRSPQLMMAPLSNGGARLIRELAETNNADCCWATDHV
jgi:GNAT superfamily N-acetyltransferase